MERSYHKCKLTKEKVDAILQQMASLFTNLGIDSSTEAVEEAYRKERELIEKIAELDENKANNLRSSY